MKARVTEGWERLFAATQETDSIDEVGRRAAAWNPLARVPATVYPDFAALRRRIEEMVDGVGRLSVTTFHSFCARVLRSFPAEAGVDPLFEVLPETAAADAWDAAFRRFLQGEFGGEEVSPGVGADPLPPSRSLEGVVGDPPPLPLPARPAARPCGGLRLPGGLPRLPGSGIRFFRGIFPVLRRRDPGSGGRPGGGGVPGSPPRPPARLGGGLPWGPRGRGRARGGRDGGLFAGPSEVDEQKKVPPPRRAEAVRGARRAAPVLETGGRGSRRGRGGPLPRGAGRRRPRFVRGGERERARLHGPAAAGERASRGEPRGRATARRAVPSHLRGRVPGHGPVAGGGSPGDRRRRGPGAPLRRRGSEAVDLRLPPRRHPGVQEVPRGDGRRRGGGRPADPQLPQPPRPAGDALRPLLPRPLRRGGFLPRLRARRGGPERSRRGASRFALPARPRRGRGGVPRGAGRADRRIGEGPGSRRRRTPRHVPGHRRPLPLRRLGRSAVGVSRGARGRGDPPRRPFAEGVLPAAGDPGLADGALRRRCPRRPVGGARRHEDDLLRPFGRGDPPSLRGGPGRGAGPRARGRGAPFPPLRAAGPGVASGPARGPVRGDGGRFRRGADSRRGADRPEPVEGRGDGEGLRMGRRRFPQTLPRGDPPQGRRGPGGGRGPRLRGGGGRRAPLHDPRGEGARIPGRDPGRDLPRRQEGRRKGCGRTGCGASPR